MIRGHFLSACIAAAMLPAAASAAQAPASAHPLATADAVTAQREVRTYAMCLARSRPRFAEDILGLPYLDEEQTRRAAQRIAGVDNCLGHTDLAAESRVPSLLEGMAVQMLRGRLVGSNMGEVSGLTDEQVQTRGLRPRNGYEDFSLCMVRAQPTQVWAFVLAEPGAPDELTTFRQVVPHVGSCVAAGQNLSLDRRGLRAVLAVGLYRVLNTLHPRS